MSAFVFRFDNRGLMQTARMVPRPHHDGLQGSVGRQCCQERRRRLRQVAVVVPNWPAVQKLHT